MAFPPDKKKPAQSGPPKKPGAPQPPGGDPMGGGGMPPPDPMGGGMPPMGADPFGGGGPPLGLQPGATPPGQPMDPMQAMLGGMGPNPMDAMTPQAQGPPVGPNGLPVGGQLPPPGCDDCGDESMGGSPLLQAMMGGMGDPYGVAPGQSDMGFQGMGTGDPSMGMQQLLAMMALGQMGVGGSGAGDLSGNPQIGMMAGM